MCSDKIDNIVAGNVPLKQLSRFSKNWATFSPSHGQEKFPFSREESLISHFADELIFTN